LRLVAAGGVPATLTARRYYGPDTVVHVALADGVTLQVGGGSPDVNADVTADLVDDATVGASVSVAVTGDVLAYPRPDKSPGPQP
jgi:iron(III) transport system ATP-binding protein